MAESKARGQRSPAWTRDEIMLVAGVVAANGWRELRPGNPEVLELSRQLRELSIHPQDLRPDDFRSPESVSRKSADIVTAHSSYRGAPTKGGALTREIVREFEKDPEYMVAQVGFVREHATGGEILVSDGIVDPDLGVPASEGGVVERAHLARERNRGIRDAKIKAVIAVGGDIACEACGFNFGVAYGPRGEGFIEVHHRVPLHVSGPTETSLTDLALLCSNCHRMIHRAAPWLTVEQLTGIVAAQGRR